MSIVFPVGNDSFSDIRDNGYYYIDKTGMISELLSRPFKANLITRPRRFGKTLSMSMLEDFFDISRDSRRHFKGLDISKEIVLCDKWMNQWPVLFLTFKSVEGNNFESAYGMLTVLISDICKKFSFLSESKQVDEYDKRIFALLSDRKADMPDVKSSLYTLTRMLTAHYGKPVILLIDEYDVPLAKAGEEGYYAQMLDVVRALLGKALKTNEFLKFAVLTGCLKIAKESIFTGMNNFMTDTIAGDRFSEYIGFTKNDVQKILMDTGLVQYAEKIKEWYDGYRFGSVDVYCPWDVVNYVSELQVNPQKEPQNYWADTSHNGVIYRFISREDMDVNDKFEILMAGECIVETITEDLTYETLNSSEENLWSLLYMTGYLTRRTDAQNRHGKEQAALCIPNEEVKSIFKKAIIGWFNQSVKSVDREKLFEAMWNGNEQMAQEFISDILFQTISYHDYQESYYHAFLAGLFAGAGYIVESNYEKETGRPDVVVKDKKQHRALVIEAKHAKEEGRMEKTCMQAVWQIGDRKYMEGVGRGYKTVIGYGIVFFEKECMVMKA